MGCSQMEYGIVLFKSILIATLELRFAVCYCGLLCAIMSMSDLL